VHSPACATLVVYEDSGAEGEAPRGTSRNPACFIALFKLKPLILVDEDLTVVGQADANTLERTRRRSFEVDSALLVATAMTWALEFLFCREPISQSGVQPKCVQAVRRAEMPA